MRDRPSVDRKTVRDEPSMAPPPERLGAHERGSRFARERDQALVPARELRGAHVIRVSAERRDPQRVVRRVRARLAATAERRHVLVRDADLTERIFERVRAEMRMAPGPGSEPYVDESHDVGGAQHRKKLLERPRAVTDGPDVHEDQCGRLGVWSKPRSVPSRPTSTMRSCTTSTWSRTRTTRTGRSASAWSGSLMTTGPGPKRRTARRVASSCA